MKTTKVKTKKYGTLMEVQSYDSITRMFYCFVPHLDMVLTIHPSAIDLEEKELDNLKMEMQNK
jgi:hypothetical protein